MAGVDCWGMCLVVYREEFGIALPSHTEDYTTTTDHELMAALMHEESMGWPEVPISEAQPGDVLMLRVMGRPWHCGLVMEPPYFLHADRNAGTVKDRWDSMRWEKRVGAVYRHSAVMVGNNAR